MGKRSSDEWGRKIGEFFEESFASDYRGGEGWRYAVPRHPFRSMVIMLIIALIILKLFSL